MPFGARRFTQLIYTEARVNGERVSYYRARFVPLDFGDADELVTHEDLLRAVDDNAREPFPKPDAEERLALAAFNAQARNKTFTRAAVESVMARGQQRALVDVVDPRERTVIERWRGILARARVATPATAANTTSWTRAGTCSRSSTNIFPNRKEPEPCQRRTK